MYEWARLRIASWNHTFYRTLLFLFTIPVCRAVLVNRTIDSSWGDLVTGFVPIYQPDSYWHDQTCFECSIQPDPKKAFDGTWTACQDGTANITLRFTGVAVWVFFILSDLENIPGGNPSDYGTHANITLDQQFAETFSYVANLTNPSPDAGMRYNSTIFSTSGLANTSHELVIGVNNYFNTGNYLIFDWAMYTADVLDDGASSSQSISSSTATTTAFPSTTHSSSVASTSPPTPAPVSPSPSKTGIIVGCTLGGLAVIALALLFLVRYLRRAPPVQNRKVEGTLDIDVPPPGHHPYYKREIPVPVRGEPMQSKAARLQEVRQRELDERIQSRQHDMDTLRPLRFAGPASEIGVSSAAGPSQPSPVLAILRNEMQQLSDEVEYLEAQRESNWAPGVSNDPLPPAYTQ